MSPKVLSTAEKFALEERNISRHSANEHNGTTRKAIQNAKLAPKQSQIQVENSKSKKDISPFRIKIGCVVALRLRPTGNSVSTVRSDGSVKQILPSESVVPMFTKPLPGRDEGLALIGKRVRCFIPKTINCRHRVIEGEIVSLPDYICKPGKAIKADLLINESILEHFPFLKRKDQPHDDAEMPTQKAKRYHQLEERIRGMKKAIVLVKLVDPARPEACKGLQWTIQKVVPPKLFHRSTAMKLSKNDQEDRDEVYGQNDNSEGNKHFKRQKSTVGPTVMHMGDGDDPDEQQIANWRWLASRYHDLMLNNQARTVDPYSANVISAGFIGEVVKVDPNAAKELSLANVTLRRLVLPEHTRTGRMPYHGNFDVFLMSDRQCDSADDATMMQVPVEELVVICRNLGFRNTISGEKTKTEESTGRLVCSHIYSYFDDSYHELSSNEVVCTLKSVNLFQPADYSCHRCLKRLSSDEAATCDGSECPTKEYNAHCSKSWCLTCIESLEKRMKAINVDAEGNKLPCCKGICDCRPCQAFYRRDLEKKFLSSLGILHTPAPRQSIDTIIDDCLVRLNGQSIIDFSLPHGFIDVESLPMPAARPSIRSKQRAIKKMRRSGTLKPSRSSLKISIGNDRSDEIDGSNGLAKRKTRDSYPLDHVREDYSVFRPTCARSLSCDESRTLCRRNALEENFVPSNERSRIHRQARLETEKDSERDDKTSSNRAARAMQRRIMKDVTAIGAFGLGIDKLSGREPVVRFERSSIHAWGVFADDNIAAGTMIVEYRGELIGNAVAEKRERQYEKAKIGSDYMFRIDSEVVCDATKQGNVARFINASCNPNCYTKIITSDGCKRIVIYAKRDIQVGEELCYDYKFPLEYDESKRIPCHCGARECRGYMNWVSISSSTFLR